MDSSQREHRFQPSARRIHESDFAAPAPHELLDDGETETSAAAGPPTARAAVETLEDARPVRGRDAGARVGDRDTGTKTIKVRLGSGRYAFVCTPHSDEMHGSFSVR